MWSDEGRQLIVSRRAALRDCETYRLNPDGSATTKLPLAKNEYVWECSRDGSWLASMTVPGGDGGKPRIALCHPDGSDLHPVVTDSIDGQVSFVISPDSKQIVYTVTTSDGLTKTRNLWVVDTDGENRRTLPLAFEPNASVRPCWSPDGRRLALGVSLTHREAGIRRTQTRVVLTDLDGKNIQTVPLPPWHLILMDWR
jgi:Tol biopolymer transport system component